MNIGLSSIGVAGHAAAAAVELAYAVYLVRGGFLKSSSDRSAHFFLAAIATSAAWSAATALEYSPYPSPDWRATAWLDLARSVAWIGFLLVLIRPAAASSRRNLFMGLASVGLMLVLWKLTVLAGAGSLQTSATVRSAASSLALAVYGLTLLEQLFRNQGDASRWNAKPVCLALGFGLVFDVYLFAESVLLGAYDKDAMAIRGAVHALAIPLLVIASKRDAFWVSKIQVSRSAAFYSATLLLVGAYLVFIAAVGYYVRFFGGSWGRALQLAMLFAALLMLAIVLVSGTLRSRLRVFVGKNFFSYRYDYRQEWLRFTSMLSSNSSPQEVGALVAQGLADMVECPAGSLWSRGLSDDVFAQTARWNFPPNAERELIGSAFCDYLRSSEWIINIEEFRSNPKQYGDLVIPLWLATSPHAWLIVPLIVAEQLIGFVVLAKPRTAVDLNWEVRDLLKTAARQAASFLAQMHATEALLEARKFDAFNRMSAFVVHDLKNIITQLSLMLKNAQRLRDNPEFQQDMLLTVESSLEKMRQMMTQLREGDRPVGTVASGVDLMTVVMRVEAMAKARGRIVEVDIADRVATRGHDQRLERVLGHVVQNALDATPSSGRVWISLSQSAGRACLTVGDSGTGMSQDFIQNQLFRPFSSTKHSGMGIGTYESHQYIKELGGSITVQSEVDRGTVITILLPLFAVQTRSDLLT